MQMGSATVASRVAYPVYDATSVRPSQPSCAAVGGRAGLATGGPPPRTPVVMGPYGPTAVGRKGVRLHGGATCA
jgi:hypothetical protein